MSYEYQNKTNCSREKVVHEVTTVTQAKKETSLLAACGCTANIGAAGGGCIAYIGGGGGGGGCCTNVA